MPDINIERILDGTFHKRIVRGFDKLKSSDLTNESALEYQEIYKNESLSNILSESELIFREPILGLDFYKEVMTSDMIPLNRYPDEIDKLNRHMAMYGEMMSEEQHDKYSSLIDNIHTIMESRKNEIMFSLRDHDSSVDSLINEMCDYLYAKKNTDSLNKFFTEAPIEEQILYGYYLLPRVDSNRLSSLLYNEMTVTESCNTDINVYSRVAKANVISTYLLEDSAIERDLKGIKNINLKMLIEESKTEDFHSVVDEIFVEHAENYEPNYTTPEDAIMRMFNDDEYYESVEEDSLTIRLVNAAKAKAVLESVLDIAYTEYLNTESDKQIDSKVISDFFGVTDMTLTEAVDNLVKRVNAMDSIIETILEDADEEEDGDSQSFFEYTRRGEATPVIRKTAGNLREEPFAPSSKKKKSAEDSSDDDDDEDDEDEDYEEPIKSSKTKKSNSKKKVDEDLDDEEVGDQPKSNKKPELQKQSLTRKIQNKAIDYDVKMQKRAASAKQAGTELKNAAKAVLRIPGNIVKSLKTGIEEWNTMNENKRKEKILQPGYRTKIFKSLKTAIVYGAIWEYKKYMVIVAFICKQTILHPFFKASSERNKRLRNELTAELETEIAVTEEKINDASANGDQRQKYELIRIKKKLEAEKVRVSTNSKYI